VLQDAFILTMVGQEDPSAFMQLVLPAMTKAMVDAEIDSEELKFAGDLLVIMTILAKDEKINMMV
jgi:hypothetical protein